MASKHKNCDPNNLLHCHWVYTYHYSEVSTALLLQLKATLNMVLLDKVYVLKC